MAVVFATYWYNLGSISHEHGPWSSFGALLSGVFTLAGAGATIATLLFLNAQSQEQKKDALKRDKRQRRRERKQAEEYQKITQAQLDTLTFERYMNHRKLFFERLTELEISFDNKFIIVNGDALYNKIFPNNGPTNLEFKVIPLCGDEGHNHIGELSKLLNDLEQMLDISLPSKIDTSDLMDLLFKLNGYLHIRWMESPSDGDLSFLGKRTGINIYSIDEFALRVKTILNSFLFYTCNPLYEGFNKGNSPQGREAFMEFFIHNRRLVGAVDIHKEINGLTGMEELYFETAKLRGGDGNFLLETTFRFLETALQSRESVLRLRDAEIVKGFVRAAVRECKLVMSNYADIIDNPSFRTIKSLIDTLDCNC